jgi:methyl coenzyme M reductase alpha subunit
MSDVRGGASTKTLTGSISIEQLYGSMQALYDDLFTGSTTGSTLSSSATANCYIGTVSPAVPVAGWFVTGWIELDLLFFRKNSLIS